MTETTVHQSTKRFAWLAVLLSILMPGVGQVYCGRLLRGLTFALLYGVVVPVVFWVIAYVGPVSVIAFGALLAAAAIGVVAVAAIDAYIAARRTRAGYELKSYNRIGVYVLLGLIIQTGCPGTSLYVRSVLFEAFRVPTASDYPTIHPHDRILVAKTVYRKSDPRRGDMILFRPPDSGWRDYYLKRIVAVAGDTVEVKEGVLRVNGQPLPQRRIGSGIVRDGSGRAVEGEVLEETNGSVAYVTFHGPVSQGSTRDFNAVKVPAGRCFVLGDNRDGSRDSRDFGPVPYAAVVGRADYIYWPADDWSRFGRLRYRFP